MEPRITTITLGVSDLARSIKFYRDGLGFPTEVEAGAPIAFFKTGGTRLVLYSLDRLTEYIGSVERPVCGQFGGITLGHNARSKEEVAEILALAEKAGGRIVRSGRDEFWGGHSGYFADPDGYLWEVAWAPMFTFSESGELNI